jgi:hypothetical protein
MKMKIKLNKWLGLTATAFVFLTALNSCIKNHVPKETDFSKITNVVDLPVNGLKALALDIKPEPEEIGIYAELGGPLLDHDVVVTLAMDPTGLDDYNTANGTSFVQLADSAYTMGPLQITIPKGQRLGHTTLTVMSEKVDLSVEGALAFKITDASGIAIATNLQSVIYSVGVKNQYDGVYTSEGVFTHPAYGTLTWVFADGIAQQLVTTGPNSVSMYPTNTSIGGFGAEMDITVNPDNTIQEIFNGSTTPTPNTDHYDPDTKTFYISGSYVGASGPRTYEATLVYSKPR